MEAPIPPNYTAHQLHQPNIFQSSQPTLVSQPDLGLEAFQFDPQLENQPDLSLQGRQAFETNPFDARAPQQPRFHEIRTNGSISDASTPQNASFSSEVPFNVQPRPTRQKNGAPNQGGQLFGILTPSGPPHGQQSPHGEAVGGFQNEIDFRPRPVAGGGTTEGHFSNMKMVPNPPHLAEWRQRLFDMDEMMTLTEDEYVGRPS